MLAFTICSPINLKNKWTVKLAVSLAKYIIGSLEEIQRNCAWIFFNSIFSEKKVSLVGTLVPYVCIIYFYY